MGGHIFRRVNGRLKWRKFCKRLYRQRSHNSTTLTEQSVTFGTKEAPSLIIVIIDDNKLLGDTSSGEES